MSYNVDLEVATVPIPSAYVAEIVIREEFRKARTFEVHLLEETRAWALDELFDLDYGYGASKTIKGRVDGLSTQGSLLVLNGRDYAYELLDRKVDAEYLVGGATGGEPVAIMTDLIDNYAPGVLTYANAAVSNSAIDQVKLHRISMFAAFNQLVLYAEDAGGDDFIWFIDKDADLNTFAEGDVDNGRSLIWMDEILSYRKVQDAWRTFDKITVYGGLDSAGDATSGSSGAGSREKIVINEFLSTDQACADWAAAIKKLYDDRTVYRLECVLSSNAPQLGETVALTLEPESISAVDHIVYAVEERVYRGITYVTVGASMPGFIDDMGTGFAIDEYLKQVKPKTIKAEHIIAMTHFFEDLVLTNNSPGAGSVAWSAFTVQYNGTTYPVNAGDTANTYAWWDFNVSTTTLQETDTPPSMTYQDALIFTNAAGIGSPVLNATVVNGAMLDALQIVGKDFRTAHNVGDAGGPAGIRFNSSEIAGYTGGTTKGFYISNDGKAYFAAGAATLDANGILLNFAGGGLGTYITWQIGGVAKASMVIRDDLAKPEFWIDVATGVNLHLEATNDDISLKAVNIILEGLSKTIGNLVPNADSSYKLGEATTPLRWLEIHGDKVFGAVYA